MFAGLHNLSRPSDQRAMWLYKRQFLITHDPANFDCHKHSGGGYIFLVVEKKDSYFCWNPPLKLILKVHGMNAHDI